MDACSGMDRLKLTLAPCNKKYLARSICPTSDGSFAGANMPPDAYFNTGWQICEGYFLFNSVVLYLVFAADCTLQNDEIGFSDCQSVAIESRLHFHFMLHG